eukprot:gene7040-14321_t
MEFQMHNIFVFGRSKSWLLRMFLICLLTNCRSDPYVARPPTWIEKGSLTLSTLGWTTIQTRFSGFKQGVVFVSLPKFHNAGRKPIYIRLKHIVHDGNVKFKVIAIPSNESTCSSWMQTVVPSITLTWMVVESGRYNIPNMDIVASTGRISAAITTFTWPSHFSKGCVHSIRKGDEEPLPGVILTLQTFDNLQPHIYPQIASGWYNQDSTGCAIGWKEAKISMKGIVYNRTPHLVLNEIVGYLLFKTTTKTVKCLEGPTLDFGSVSVDDNPRVLKFTQTYNDMSTGVFATILSNDDSNTLFTHLAEPWTGIVLEENQCSKFENDFDEQTVAYLVVGDKSIDADVVCFPTDVSKPNKPDDSSKDKGKNAPKTKSPTAAPLSTKKPTSRTSTSTSSRTPSLDMKSNRQRDSKQPTIVKSNRDTIILVPPSSRMPTVNYMMKYAPLYEHRASFTGTKLVVPTSSSSSSNTGGNGNGNGNGGTTPGSTPTPTVISISNTGGGSTNAMNPSMAPISSSPSPYVPTAFNAQVFTETPSSNPMLYPSSSYSYTNTFNPTITTPTSTSVQLTPSPSPSLSITSSQLPTIALQPSSASVITTLTPTSVQLTPSQSPSLSIISSQLPTIALQPSSASVITTLTPSLSLSLPDSLVPTTESSLSSSSGSTVTSSPSTLSSQQSISSSPSVSLFESQQPSPASQPSTSNSGQSIPTITALPTSFPLISVNNTFIPTIQSTITPRYNSTTQAASNRQNTKSTMDIAMANAGLALTGFISVFIGIAIIIIVIIYKRVNKAAANKNETFDQDMDMSSSVGSFLLEQQGKGLFLQDTSSSHGILDAILDDDSWMKPEML